MNDPFEIPSFADRRGEKVDRTSIRKVLDRKRLAMPNPKRVAAMRKANREHAKRTAHSLAKDMKLAAKDDVIDQAAEIGKVKK